MHNQNEQPRIAVLIDADNSQPSIVDGLLAEISTYGVASVKRIYGDWTKPNLRGWKDTLLTHGIQPIQQFSYTTGKNSTDAAMIIDAMDLLNSGRFDGFCIVSSDSDFTRLASRIRETGPTVYGFGEKKTPQAFVSACDKFVYTEILRDHSKPAEASKKKTSKQLRSDARLVNALRNAVDSASDENGWTQLGPVGSKIPNLLPDFDARNYGYKKLRDLVEASNLFEVENREVPGSDRKVLYVRDKRR